MPVDTVVFNDDRRVRPDLWDPLSNCTMFHLGGWEITNGKTHAPCGSDIQIPTFSCRMTHVETGIVVTAKQSQITSIQASLPRVLYGSNGICLSSDEEIQKALTIVSQRVDEIATEPQTLPQFKSVHFTLNHQCDPRKVIQAHRQAKFIFVHSDAESYSNDLDRYHHRNLRWKGSNVVLTMYNKALEMTRRNRKLWITRTILGCFRPISK